MAISDHNLSRRQRHASSILALLLLLGAGVIMAGWLMHAPSIVHGIAGTAMVFSTASCFAVLALAMLADDVLPPPLRKGSVTLLGSLVMLAGILALVESATGLDLAIDWSSQHRWLEDDNPYPGRMSRLTAAGFVIAGAALLRMHRVRSLWSGLLVQALTALVIAVGVVGTASWLLKLPLVYRNYLFGHISFSTSIGFVIAGAGLWLGWRRMEWYRSRSLLSKEESRIGLNAASLLAIVVSVSLLTGFAILSRQLDELMQRGLLAPLNERANALSIALDLRTALAQSIAENPAHIGLLQRLRADRADRAALEQFRGVAKSYLQFGFSALAMQDVEGATLASVGVFAAKPDSVLRLDDKTALLRRGNDLLLETRLQVESAGEVLGFVLAEQHARGVKQAIEYARESSDHGDIALCGHRPGGLSCLPKGSIARALEKPIARALAGETAVAIGIDDQGDKIIVAFRPLGRFGIGMALSVDAAELYAPLRGQLYLALVLLAAMVTVGAVLVRWHITPLARSVLLNERRLQLALESSTSAAWDLDLRTNQVHLSEQWPALLGAQPAATSVALEELYRLVHPEDLLLVQRKLHATLKSDDMPYDVEHRVRAVNGDWIWLHSKGRVVERDPAGRALRMIGVNTDITSRKRAETMLEQRGQRDPVTGLPNRAVFTDRLEVAMARTRRSEERNRLLAVLCLHVDGLAEVPKSLGAAVTDLLLQEFSRRLAGCLAAGETVARLANDEFAILLEDLEQRERSYGIAEALIAAIQPEFVLNGSAVSVGTSIGIAFYDGAPGITSLQLIAKARQSMFDAHNFEPNSYLVAI